MFVQTQLHLQLKFKTLHLIQQPHIQKQLISHTYKSSTVFTETESGRFQVYFEMVQQVTLSDVIS